MTGQETSSRTIWSIGLIAAALAAIAAGFFLPLQDWLRLFTDWVNGLGAAGIAIFAAGYVIAVVLLLPTWVLTVSAGLAFGFLAIPLVVASASVGAVLAFLIARYAFRERVKVMIQNRPVLKALDAAVKTDGWKIVGLLRLSPLVPFNLQNYFFGATNVALVQYAVATFFGIIPGTSLYVYIGTLGRAAASSDDARISRILLLALGLAATLAAIAIITRKARSMLRQAGVVSAQV
ncbi:MAG: TVP38/TMEM64 family protein [Variibacter sp.]